MAKKNPTPSAFSFLNLAFTMLPMIFSWKKVGDLLQQGGASAIVEPKQEEPLFSLVAIHR